MSLFSEQQNFYGKVKSLALTYETQPCLRVCVTEKCNLNCFYCHKEGMQAKYENYLDKTDYTFIAKTFSALGLKKVKFTGGEPLLRQDLFEIIKIFKQAGFEDISLVTNGSLLDREKLEKLRESGLGRITISFDTINKKTAIQMNNCPNIEKVLDNTVLARAIFENVKVNCVIVPGMNFPEEILDITNFCRDNRITLKILTRLSEDQAYPLSAQALNLIKMNKTLVKKEINEKSFVPSSKYFFSDGTNIEINDFRNEEYRKKIENSAHCRNCPQKGQCVEGPYAIRIMPNGDIKSCLIRQDNAIRFMKIKRRHAKLICLTGLTYSGKTEFAKIAEKTGIKVISIGKTLKEELARKNIEPSYQNIMELSKKICEESGSLGALEKSLEPMEKEFDNEKIIIIDSVRRTEEYSFLKQFFKTYLVGITCSKKERFRRAEQKGSKLTAKQLAQRDKIETGKIDSIQKFNIGELLGSADYYLSGETPYFKGTVSEIIKEIAKD
ncbi:MAG: radical SAM protein [Candidatus ainarchaeum sp.]|nr:radical SAM protein [Candidatus ainarchaeum sp.]